MLQTSLLSFLKESGFKPPVYGRGLGRVSELLPHTQHPGIHVLHFADGSAYVGQSRDVAQRLDWSRSEAPVTTPGRDRNEENLFQS